MASLKEIKGRISSVKSTQKITSAMKMISSAKLRKSQNRIESFLPYQNKLTEITNNLIASQEGYSNPLVAKRPAKRVAIVAITSNSSLCGAFNSNIINLVEKKIIDYKRGNIEVEVYSIGKKIEDHLRAYNKGIKIIGGYTKLADSPNFNEVKEVVDGIMADFLGEKIDRVEVFYNHFKSVSTQIPSAEVFLPINLEAKDNDSNRLVDYIVEPDKSKLLDELIPKSLRTRLFSKILDSLVAEQAARMMAMQIATDNAEDLLSELSVQYNKQRQQAITSELLDIIGGSEALK